MAKQFLYYVSVAILTILVSGCAKKTPKNPLKPLKSYTYTQSNGGLTLQVGYVSPKQFNKIYPRGLGKYVLLDQHELYKGKKLRNIRRRVRLLQGTIINDSTKRVTISRKGISLPTIPSYKAYQQNTFLRNFSFTWLSLWGSFTLFFAYLSFVVPVPVFVIPTLIGAVFSIPGATVGTIEQIKESNRQKFAYATILDDKAHSVAPGESFSWLMMIPYRKYNPEFTVTYKDEDAVKHCFNVSI